MSSARAVPIYRTAARPRTLETTLSILIALAIVLVFWTQQRYPALVKKLHAGQGIQVKGAISFDALLSVTPQMSPAVRIARTTVNWLWTNRFGMYFAIPFGAVMMTLLAPVLGGRRFSSPAGNVLCGAVGGMPLGVCANCATPIGQGLLAGGTSSRMAVAAMISSPSFNPVVLAMVFLLFPLPLALARWLAPALLLTALPWLVKETPAPVLRGISMPETPEALGPRLAAYLASFGKNLLRLTWLTLPWMIVAAVAGAILAEVVPAYGTHLPVSFIGVVAVALLGTLLPVPMALDVALAYVLYHSGVPVPYVAALLCTLGPVSIYSLTALGQQLERSAALRLAGATILLGSLAGWLAMGFPSAF